MIIHPRGWVVYGLVWVMKSKEKNNVRVPTYMIEGVKIGGALG